MLSRLKTALRALLRRSQAERELDDELRHHIERQTEQNIRLGMSPEDARYAAQRAFGGVEQAKERSRDSRGVRWFEELWQDLRYGARMLAKNPGFTLIAVLTLALGIGANTAIFSVVNAVLLRPLPYPEPDQLSWVWLDNRREGIHEDITSFPNFVDWRDQNQVFQGLAGVNGWAPSLTGMGEPEELRGASVSANFFALMDVNPMLGRGFLPAEEEDGHDQVVVISHGLWQRRFGGALNVINQTLNLSGRGYTVVGIMPPGFQFPTKAELWKPLAPTAQTRAARNSLWLQVFGRIKSGVTRAQAQAEMDVIARRLEEQYPGVNRGFGINVVPMHEQLVGKARPALMVLLAAVACVLLIACANVANMLLSRAAARQREIAVRAALGASRWRIVRQLLTESVLVAVLGGVLGLLLAVWGLELLRALGPADLPRLENIGVDGRALAFTLTLSFLTGLVFGLAPALQTAKLGLNEILKEAGQSKAGGHRLRKLLVVSEITLALVLLIGGGLMIRSSWLLQQVEPGFNPERLLTARLSLPRSRYPEGPQVIAFYQQVSERLATQPGVLAVGATSSVMMEKMHQAGRFTIEGRPVEPQAQRPELPYDAVTPGYFKTMGIPFVKGREFTEQDTGQVPVTIINETMARRFWPGEDPLGKRFKFGNLDSNNPWLTIVGVAHDVKRLGLDTPVRIECYVPHRQLPTRSMELVMRTTASPLTMSRPVRAAVWTLDKDLPITKLLTIENVLRETVAPRHFNMLLLGLFAAVALFLAAVGIYGVMSYVVTQRTREIGIRMALGAQSRDVLNLVIGQGMKLTLIGVLIGSGGALALTRLMKTLLFGVSATDPLTYLVIALLLMLVALLACWIPAWRATKVDPLVALKYE
jgi:putative ABC transport system permease protein